MDYQRYSISSRILNLICVLIIQHQHIHGSVTLTVSPSGDVEVNQTVTIQCSFELNPIVAIFYSSRNPTSQFCDLEPSGGVCKPNTCSRNYVTTCPNDTTYSVQYPVPQSWNGASVYCVGLSGVERSNQVAFSVTVLVTSLTLTPVQISVDASEHINLMCRTDYCNPAANITWYKSSTVISSQITSTTDSNSDGLHRTTSVLTYTGVAGDNGQQVYCRASNRQGVYVESNKDLLDVRYPPSFDPAISASPPGLQYDNGTHVSLTCELSGGNPVAMLSWRCKGVDMTGTNQSSTTTSISLLSLLMDSSYNNKQCTCTANHRLLTSTKSESVLLTVFYNNVILSSLNKEYVINEYGRLQIKCDVDGNPLSTITWMFVQNNTAVKRDSNVNSSTLDISSANCLDHGSYKVTAENGKGPAAVRTTNLVVRCKPRLHYSASQTPDSLVIGNCDFLQILVRLLLYPPATLIQWTFIGENNVSRVLQNNTDGYRITDAKGENEQTITLHKSRVYAEDFGDYTLMVQNGVGTFYRSYQVDTSTPPLIPTNVTLDCGNPFSIKLSWISNFNGGDSQTFKISYSTVGNISDLFKDVEYIHDEGYGRLYSYTPSIELQGTVWFTVTAFNMLGKSTSNAVHCTVAGIQESVENQTGVAVGSAVGIVTFIIIILVLVIFLRRRYTFIIKLERKNIDKGVKRTDLTKDESSIPMAERTVHLHGERGMYEELTEKENGNQYEGLSTKDQQESERQIYESIQGSSGESKYEKLSTVSKKEDDDDKYQNSQKPKTSSPSDVYLNASFQN
ncbi:hemicentin-1-like isoform X2 [Ostrea edulis]|uniref:hemicentin-1-like isoform X2 n=1 Tax=Ostrea edulis TaxID=37623 RepID=UPI0024AFAC1C|nr:hemicentin-1-like isoform X2 [Ostrea edulis]